MNTQQTLGEVGEKPPEETGFRIDRIDDRAVSHPAQTACYVRGKDTEEVHTDIERVLEFCRTELDHSWIDRDAIGELRNELPGNDLPTVITNTDDRGILIAADIAARGGDTNRDGLQTLFQHIPDYDHLSDFVTPAADRIVDQEQELNNIRALISGFDLTIHLVEQGITVRQDTAFAATLVQTMSSIADVSSTADLAVSSDRQTGGRPPLGYTSLDGRLVPAETYEQVREVLLAVKHHGMSKREAARELDCTRKTIRRALDHPDRYDL